MIPPLVEYAINLTPDLRSYKLLVLMGYKPEQVAYLPICLNFDLDDGAIEITPEELGKYIQQAKEQNGK